MKPISLISNPVRPRERLQDQGVDALSLEDLVSLILGSGSSSNDVTHCARQVIPVLLKRKPNIRQLTSIEGVGVARATALLAAVKMSEKIRQYQLELPELSSPDLLYKACQDLLTKTQEHLVVFYLSSHSTILQRETVTIGTATASLIHPREVFRAAIVHNASAIALAHNHPSGNTTPSKADLDVTKEIAKAGSVIGISLIDHLICSPLGYTSLKIASPYLFC